MTLREFCCPVHDFTQLTPRRHKKNRPSWPVRFVNAGVLLRDEIVAQRISERPRHFRRKTLFIKTCFTRCR
ncbi:hypothetical protein DNM39_00790 [Salmonella enterica subsp. enterica]|nr:hypothetical protein [Salmonella enterica subsp. enterica serovar Colorado]EBW2326114.1 hypothetical protein [Salmonella enterica subsp. enterica serovar Agoueve]ECE5859537.1 hypothetical protein [Salmonella enterica subsp. enterica]